MEIVDMIVYLTCGGAVMLQVYMFARKCFSALLGTVRVDDPGVIQCAIQVAIHETGSRPQNRGKGGSRIV